LFFLFWLDRIPVEISETFCGHNQINQPAILVSVNETKNPSTTNRRDQSWVSAKASGIIVSTIIASMPPAATAVVAATMNGESASKTA
jgi:hypothetical protein